MANEKRLIEVESAWQKAQKIFSDSALLLAIRVALDKAPTVDAVEVVHGRWIPDGDDDQDEGMFHCSVCKDDRWFGEEVYTSEEAERLCHYCPNCGAKMDGDGNA